MTDTVYIDPKESNANIAGRYPHLVEHVPGGLRYIGPDRVIFELVNDSIAAEEAAIRRFARGG